MVKRKKRKKNYWNLVKNVIYKSDIVLEVVDARFPADSRNHYVEELVDKLNKKLVIVINKADLVPESFLKKVVKQFSEEYPTIYLSARDRHGTRNLLKLINKLRGDRWVKVGVVGYPNVGKSMVINVLKGRHSAPVAGTPGFTKGKQFLKVTKDIMLIDTPGVSPIRGKRSLAAKCAIDVSHSSDAEDLVVPLIKILNKKNPRAFKELYGFPVEDPYDFIEKIAEKYNLKMSGGKPDIQRAAVKIYKDWLTGKLKIYWL